MTSRSLMISSPQPAQLTRTPGRLRLPAPCFGQHNRYVFGELLGMSDEDIMRLKREGVTAEEPLPYEEI